MTNETMTVHEALCELKTLPKRVEKAISMIEPVATKEESSKKVNGIDVDAYKKEQKALAQSAEDLITRYFALKVAINQYNAEAKINVAGKEYTVAQAIWMLQHGMDYKRRLRDHYARALTASKSAIAVANGDQLLRKAETAANSVFVSKDKASTEEYNNFIETYKKNQTLVLVDPLDINKKIAVLEKEIDEFQTGVDAALQVKNATTQITISY